MAHNHSLECACTYWPHCQGQRLQDAPQTHNLSQAIRHETRRSTSRRLTCSTACLRAMLSTAAVWLLFGLGLSPMPLPAAEGPITNPPGPTASCVLNPVSMPRRPPLPPLLPAAAAAELPGQKQPGAAAALEGAMCAPDVAERAPLLLSEPACTGSCMSRSGLGLSPGTDLLVLPKNTAHIFLIASADRTERLCELPEPQHPWY
jgi:hypothetical protein